MGTSRLVNEKQVGAPILAPSRPIPISLGLMESHEVPGAMRICLLGLSPLLSDRTHIGKCEVTSGKPGVLATIYDDDLIGWQTVHFFQLISDYYGFRLRMAVTAPPARRCVTFLLANPFIIPLRFAEVQGINTAIESNVQGGVVVRIFDRFLQPEISAARQRRWDRPETDAGLIDRSHGVQQTNDGRIIPRNLFKRSILRKISRWFIAPR